MEAEAQDIEEDSWYQDQSSTARRNRLRNDYSVHAINKRVTVTEEERASVKGIHVSGLNGFG